ncbi:MAG: MauE/DoxX family redox-associated membrane protein [Solirubrobacteraceae bacterium]
MLVAGARKLAPSGRVQLAAALREYAIIPSVWLGAVAQLLPWLELSLGALLGAGVLLVPAGLCASLVFGIFAVAVAWHVLRGRRFKCGCGNGATISWSLAARDLALSVIAAAVTIYPHAALVSWVGPGWIQVAPESFVSVIPVPMTMLLLGAGWRLIRAASPLSQSIKRSVFSVTG